MYKKVCCTCKAVVLLILTYCFFDIISHGHCRSDIFNSPLEVSKRMFRIVAVLSPVNRFWLITDQHGNHIYGFTVCCSPENVLQCDEPTSPLYYDHLLLMDAGALHFLFTWHNEPTTRTQAEEKEAISVVKFALSVCVFMVVTYLLSQLPNHTPHPNI